MIIKQTEVSNLNHALMALQAQTKIRFDVDKAKEVHRCIVKEMRELEKKIEPCFPLTDIPKSRLEKPPKASFKKDGSFAANLVKWCDKNNLQYDREGVVYPDGVKEPFPLYRPLYNKEKITLKNTGKVKEWLQEEKKWEPFFFNKGKNGERTTPKYLENGVIDPGLEVVDWEYVKEFIHYQSLNHRRKLLLGDTETSGLINKQIDGWLKPGSGGYTNTHRQKHREVVNLPAVGSLYGEEIRSCFIAELNELMVGYDASSLENRNKGHLTYEIDGGEYARKILEPGFDPHMELANKVFPNMEDRKAARTKAKAPNYAIPYGCGVSKLARLLDCEEEEAAHVLAGYWEVNEPVRIASKRLEKEIEKRGYIKTPGGRRLYSRQPYKAFNLACQGMGSEIMETAAYLMTISADSINWVTGEIRYKGRSAYRRLFMHDEYMYTCDPELADWLGRQGCRSIEATGQKLGLHVELKAEYMVGNNYAECH